MKREYELFFSGEVQHLEKYLFWITWKKAKLCGTVKIHYTERTENGKVIDTSKDNQPLEITIGRNLIPIF